MTDWKSHKQQVKNFKRGSNPEPEIPTNKQKSGKKPYTIEKRYIGKQKDYFLKDILHRDWRTESRYKTKESAETALAAKTQQQKLHNQNWEFRLKI